MRRICSFLQTVNEKHGFTYDAIELDGCAFPRLTVRSRPPLESLAQLTPSLSDRHLYDVNEARDQGRHRVPIPLVRSHALSPT